MANRSPSASTMIEYGIERSPTMNAGLAAGRRRDRGAPPRVVHELDRGAELLRGLDRAAEVARVARRVAVDAVVLLPPVRVLVEPAAGEHHAAVRADRHRPARRAARGRRPRGRPRRRAPRAARSATAGCRCLYDHDVEERGAPAPLPMPTSSLAAHRRRRASGRRTARRARSPTGVDHARPSSQTSSVLSGQRHQRRGSIFHHAPIFLESNGLTSIARPILPPGSSG